MAAEDDLALSPPPGPPRAPRRPVRRARHGVTDVDDHAWMRDPDDPDLRGYLAAERAWYDAHAARWSGLAADLEREAAARTPASADSVEWPAAGGPLLIRTPAGAENPQLIRVRSGEANQVLLDAEQVAAATGFADIGDRVISPDGRLLAWSADTTGAENYRLRVRDTAAGADLPEVTERTCPGLAWGAGSDWLLYLVPDELHRPWQVWRHTVGTPASDDVLVMAEPDARFELELRASRSGELALVTAQSRDTTEVTLIPLDRPGRDPVLVEPRRRGVEYRADHLAGPDGGELYLVTDDGEAEFRLMRAPVRAPGRASWQPVDCSAIAPARADTRLLDCGVFDGHLLLALRRDGGPLLAITDLDGGAVREITPQFPAGDIRVEHAEDYRRGSVIIAEESLTEPLAWSELDLASGQRRLLKRAEVPGYDPGAYRTERTTARAGDGTAIPVTLAYRAGTPLDGTAPCLLYGYGAYEACSDPEFSASLPSLLDRGVVYAIGHIRGGGEGGRRWWQQGRLRAKPTTFSDFIAVADGLAGAVVDGTRIVSRGLSAGGLLQGAVFSLAPQRWRAVVAEVPFVDCVTTMLDPSIPLTVNEWDEWGDPRDPGDFAVLRSYSPYDNPPPGPRPDLLVTGTVHDPRVLIHEPAKWVARLRDTEPPGAAGSLLFRAELGAGAHTGPSGRFAQLAYEAEVQAFILCAMGLSGGRAAAGTPPPGR
jgi:oligopeptidase B